MKQILFILFAGLTLLSDVNAQTSEQVSQLIPIASNVGKFSKRLPPDRNRIINKDNLKFKVLVEPTNLPTNKKGVVVTIKISYQELVFTDLGGELTTRVKIYGRVTSKGKSTDGFFEERISEIADINELKKGINKEIVLRKVFELSEETYQIGVIITDVESGIRGVKVLKFKVS